MVPSSSMYIFFFNDTATTEIYTLSLHDALPIWAVRLHAPQPGGPQGTGGRGFTDRRAVSRGRGNARRFRFRDGWESDRKSTRLNSSHANISYAVFCLKKKKYITKTQYPQ